MKSLRYSISVAVLAALATLLLMTRESGAAGQPNTVRTRHLVESIAVKLNCLGEIWTFRGEKDGIVIDVAGKGRNRQDRPVDLQGIGKVNRISASMFEYSSGDSEHSFIGLAIESESRDGKQLEYRMALCRLETKQPIWSVSEALTTRPIDKPYHAMGVGLPSGDSLMMTLQSLTRPMDMPEQASKFSSQPVDDLIETDLFVNHCPMGTPMIIGTQHYLSNKMTLVNKQLSKADAADQCDLFYLSAEIRKATLDSCGKLKVDISIRNDSNNLVILDRQVLSRYCKEGLRLWSPQDARAVHFSGFGCYDPGSYSKRDFVEVLPGREIEVIVLHDPACPGLCHITYESPDIDDSDFQEATSIPSGPVALTFKLGTYVMSKKPATCREELDFSHWTEMKCNSLKWLERVD